MTPLKSELKDLYETINKFTNERYYFKWFYLVRDLLADLVNEPKIMLRISIISVTQIIPPNVMFHCYVFLKKKHKRKNAYSLSHFLKKKTWK